MFNCPLCWGEGEIEQDIRVECLGCPNFSLDEGIALCLDDENDPVPIDRIESCENWD